MMARLSHRTHARDMHRLHLGQRQHCHVEYRESEAPLRPRAAQDPRLRRSSRVTATRAHTASGCETSEATETAATGRRSPPREKAFKENWAPDPLATVATDGGKPPTTWEEWSAALAASEARYVGGRVAVVASRFKRRLCIPDTLHLLPQGPPLLCAGHRRRGASRVG